MGVKLFNGGPVPLVPDGRWGEGVVMPGEYIEVDNPDSYGTPWTQDEEAAQALLSLPDPGTGVTPETVTEGVSGPQDGSQAPNPEPPPGEGPELHTLDNGDVVNSAGQVVGHIEPNAVGHIDNATPGGNA